MIVRRYKKWAKLVLPILISSLKDSDIDTVKGALHTLRLGTLEHTLARNWEFTGDYVSAVFEAFENFDRVYPLIDIADEAICSKSLFDCHYFLGEI